MTNNRVAARVGWLSRNLVFTWLIMPGTRNAKYARAIQRSVTHLHAWNRFRGVCNPRCAANFPVKPRRDVRNAPVNTLTFDSLVREAKVAQEHYPPALRMLLSVPVTSKQTRNGFPEETSNVPHIYLFQSESRLNRVVSFHSRRRIVISFSLCFNSVRFRRFH